MKVSSTAERLKLIMRERNLKQVDILNLSKPLQEKLNIKMGKSTLSQYVNGVQNPDQSRTYLLSKTLDVSEPWLMGFDVDRKRIPDSERGEVDTNPATKIYDQLNKHNKTQFIEYGEKLLDSQNKVIHLDDYIEETQTEGVQLALHGRLSAGTGTINYDRTNPEMIIYYGKVPKHDLCFIVKGDSMTPLFKDSEIIFIERTFDIRSGQVIAVSINGEEYVKKAYKEENQLRLVSLNKKYEDITANEFDDIRVIGRVIL